MDQDQELKYAMRHSQNQGTGYPAVFPIDYGMDFHLETKPELYPEPRHNPRRAVIEITSFIGSVAWAMHYYADIKADGIRIIDEVEQPDGTKRKCGVGGYICQEYSELKRELKSKWSSQYHISISQEVTSEMIHKDPVAWDGYEEGYPTSRFDTKREAIDVATRVAKARFPGWEIVVDDKT